MRKSSEPKVFRISLDQLNPESGIQIRSVLHQPTVNEYVAAMKLGQQFPAIIAFRFHADSELVVVDGFHRLAAARKAGAKEILVEVKLGDRKAATKAALASNATHGLPRANRDKKRAVQTAICEFPGLSARKYAEMCAVSVDLAARTLRDKVSADDTSSSSHRIGKDGKRYPIALRQKATPGATHGGQNVGKIQTVATQANQTERRVAQLRNPAATEIHVADVFSTSVLDMLPGLAAALPEWEAYVRTALNHHPELKPALRGGFIRVIAWLDAIQPTTTPLQSTVVEHNGSGTPRAATK